MSMFRSRIPGVSSKALAHNNVMQGLVGNKELKELQDMITAEKAVIASTQKLAADLSRASECLKAWGTGEGDDLGDIFMHSNTLLQHISASLAQYAQHEETIRTHMKAIRTREEGLDEVKRRRRGVAIKADGAEKKLSRMSEENRHLEAQRTLLNQLREEMRQLDHDIMVEEAALSDYKRTTSKDWMLLKFGGLLEHAQKAVQVGQAGKALIEEIPLAITTPGFGRVPYGGHQRTEGIISECGRAIEQISFQPTTSVAYHHPAHGMPPQPPQPQPDPNRAPNQAYPNGGGSFSSQSDPWAQSHQHPPAAPNAPPGYGGLPPGPMPHVVGPNQPPPHSATFAGSGSAPMNHNEAYGEFGQFVPPHHSQTVGPAGGMLGHQPQPSSFQNVPVPNAEHPQHASPSMFGTFPGTRTDPAFDRLGNNASPASPAPPPKDLSLPTTQSGFAPPVSSPAENPWSATTPTGPPVLAGPPISTGPPISGGPTNLAHNQTPASSGKPLPRPTSGGSLSDGSSMVLAYYNSYGDESAPATGDIRGGIPGHPGSPKGADGPKDDVRKSEDDDLRIAYADSAFSAHDSTSPTRPEFKPQETSSITYTPDKRGSSTSKAADSVREADAAAAREIGRELGLLGTTSTATGAPAANPPPRTSSRQPRQQTLPVYTPLNTQATNAANSSTAPYELPSFSALPSLSLSFSASEPFAADFSSIQFSPVNTKSTGPPVQTPPVQQDVSARFPSSESHPKPSSFGGEGPVSSQSPPRVNIATATFDPNVIPTANTTGPSQAAPTSPGGLGPDRTLTASPAASLASVSAESVLPPPPKLPFVSMNSGAARTSSSMPGSTTRGISPPSGGDGPRTISAAAFRRRPLPTPSPAPGSGEALDAGNTAGVGIGSPGIAPLQVRKKATSDISEAPPLASNPSYTSATSGYGSTPYTSAPTSPARERSGFDDIGGGEGGSHTGYQPSPLALPGNQQRYHSPTSEFSHNHSGAEHPPMSQPAQPNPPYPQMNTPAYSAYPQQPQQYQQQGQGYSSPAQSPWQGGGSPHTFSSGHLSQGEPMGVAVGSPSTAYDGYNAYPNHADNRQTIGEHGWKPMGHPQYPQTATSPNDQQQQQQQQYPQQQGSRPGYENGRFATSLD